jgi:LuxR family transcriptional regulator, maltose regulon positive regulatory protein
VLQDLDDANAFAVSLDAARSWFRYHHLFADLLQLELRRTEPGRVTTLHQDAADWLADHGYPVDAIRHAQAAQTIHELVAGFPASTADAELAALAAADFPAHGSLEEASGSWAWPSAERGRRRSRPGQR